MSNVSVIQQKNNTITAPRSYSPKEIDLIRRTVAKDTKPDEFNMFIEVCKRQGLDPFRRQVYALVFNKDDESKRRVSFITGIDGYRAIARRTGQYRPDDHEPIFDYDEDLKCPDTNPLGLRKATVKIYQYAVDGWYPVVGIAHWKEFAPVMQEKELVPELDSKGNPVLHTSGKWKGSPKKTWKPVEGGRKWLEKETWKTMPQLMLAKCAEAQALRKAFPEEMGGIYIPEEMDKAIVQDKTSSEIVEEYQNEQRQKMVNAIDHIPLIVAQSEGITMIEDGKVFDTVLKTLREFDSEQDIDFWLQQNRVGLQQFWAGNQSDAIELKREIEKLKNNLKKTEQTQELI